MFEFYEMIKRWSYASAAASGGELWESRILDRLSFVSFWRFLVCITCWCKQHGWMLLIPVSLSYKKLSYNKHKGGLLVLSILWFSLLLLARYTPGLVRINFDRRWYALLRPRCPSVHRCFSACLCRIQICCRLDTIRKLPGHQWLCGVTSFWLGKHSKAVGVSKIQKGEKENGACIHQRIHKHWMALQGWDVEVFFHFSKVFQMNSLSKG